MLLPEKKLCEFIQTASPGLPLMRGKRRLVVMENSPISHENLNRIV